MSTGMIVGAYTLNYMVIPSCLSKVSSSVATLASKTTPTIITSSTNSNSGTPRQEATLVQNLFEGVLTSETRCLTCETVSCLLTLNWCYWLHLIFATQVSSRDESFLDLSIDIEQNSSVTACLRQFSASEMLCQKNKFFCDSCCDLQEAEKRCRSAIHSTCFIVNITLCVFIGWK